MEVQHLLRVTSSPTQLAKNFAVYCKRYAVITRGLCKIGYVNRSTSPSSPPLRGLLANKDLKKGENVVMLSERACLHPGRALRCTPFLQLLPSVWRETWLNQPRVLLHNERLFEGALIRHHQWLLALYMSYMILGHRLRPEVFHTGASPTTTTAIPDADVIDYLDFMPRTEGDFRLLSIHLTRSLDSSAPLSLVGGGGGAGAMVQECESALAKHFAVTPAEVRAVVLYTLCMLFSRMVPVDHKGLLRASFRYTPLAKDVVEALLEQEPPSSIAHSSHKEGGGVEGGGDGAHVSGTVETSPIAYAAQFVREPLSFLCPVIDMCNHASRAAENVAVMVPSSSSITSCESVEPSRPEGHSSPHPFSVSNSTSPDSSSFTTANTSFSGSPILCLRTLKDISKGEELRMCYGDSLNELQVIWGMPEVVE